MYSEQYVESVKQMMNQQNVFFSVFITILAIVLGFIGIIQWRLSSKQIELIKQQTKKEVEKEIAQKLGVDEIVEFPKMVKSQTETEISIIQESIQELTEAMVDFKHKYWLSETDKFRNGVTKIHGKDFDSLSNFSIHLRIYKSIIENDIGNFNFFINNLSHWVSNNEKYAMSQMGQFQTKEIIKDLKLFEKNLNFENSLDSSLRDFETKIEILKKENPITESP